MMVRNTASSSGGGISLVDSTLAVTGSTFLENATPVENQHAGGAIIGRDSHATFENCVFEGNVAWHGGALANVDFTDGDSTFAIHNCVMMGNASAVGGALFNQDAMAIVSECLIIGNEVSGDFGGYGGGILNLVHTPTLIVADTLIVGNVAEVDGGGIASFFEVGGTTIVNSTIAQNTAGGSGGGVFLDVEDQATVHNSILWANWDGGGQDESAQIHAFGPLSIAFSCIEGLTGGLGGVGNIGADPLFVNPDNGDYRLTAASACIDAGNNNAIADLAETDLDGNPRFADDPATADTGCGVPVVVDMGAYEFQGDPARVVFADLTGDGTVGVDDVEMLLDCWSSSEGPCCVADLDLDGTVSTIDLLILLGKWGS
jgi:hypothetical protein